MSSLLEPKITRPGTPCDRFQEWLEQSSGQEAGLETYESLLARAPLQERAHADTCSDCRDAASDLVALQILLRDLDAPPAVQPWFAPRVIAAINSKEAEMSRGAAIWLAVPKFAARLSWVAAAALVFTCAWLYERPATQPPQSASAFASEHLFDPPALPANHDDVLVSMTEKDQ